MMSIVDGFIRWLATPSVLVANVAYAQDNWLIALRNFLEATGINQLITALFGILLIIYWSGKIYEMFCRHWYPKRYKKIKKDGDTHNP
jgi:hypothetical protein